MMIFLSTVESVVESTSVELLVSGKVILEVVEEAKEIVVVEKNAIAQINKIVILSATKNLGVEILSLRSRMTELFRMTGLPPPLLSPP